MYLIAVTANQDGDDERSTSQTELDRHGHTRNGQGEGTEDESDDDADEYGGDVGCIQTAHGVAHLVGHAVYGIFRTDNHDFVAYLQGQGG